MFRDLSLLALALALTWSGAARAEPSAEIAKLMKTPASVFDVFLFRLYESVKCSNWVGEVENEPDFCMTGLHYDNDRNVLTMHFRAYPTNEPLGDFLEVDDLERQDIMTRYIEQVARVAGVQSEWGLLQSIPFHYAGAQPIPGEAAIRSELARRTELRAFVRYEGKVYSATRYLNGKVTASVKVRP